MMIPMNYTCPRYKYAPTLHIEGLVVEDVIQDAVMRSVALNAVHLM